MRTITRAHTARDFPRISLYRALRHITGPALAYRLSFVMLKNAEVFAPSVMSVGFGNGQCEVVK